VKKGARRACVTVRDACARKSRPAAFARIVAALQPPPRIDRFNERERSLARLLLTLGQELHT